MFSFETVGAITFVRLAGKRLDLANATRFREEFEKEFETGRHLVLDLSEVDFMDSTGIGAIIAFQRKSKSAGKELHICSPTLGVQTIFKLLRFHRIMKVFSSRKEATQELSK